MNQAGKAVAVSVDFGGHGVEDGGSHLAGDEALPDELVEAVLIRGQLTENYFKTNNKLPWILKLILSKNLGNFLTRPDFIAYRYRDRKSTFSNRLCMKRMAGVSWTIVTQAEFDTAVEEGWIPIFEGFRPDPCHPRRRRIPALWPCPDRWSTPPVSVEDP